nr:hypothetical protein [Tanacetum cinerariifolium]
MFKRRCVGLTGLLKDRDAKVASLKVQFSLKEAEAAEAIHLHGQIATVEATEAAWVSELDGLKEQNAVLERQVAALDSTTIIKDTKLGSSNTQIDKMTQDLSNLQLYCDELSIKSSSLESDKDKLIDQVSKLEGTCSELRDEVSGYKLFKEQIEVVQDEQVKILSDKVAGIGADLMGMALHLDEEFYPCFLITIAERRWILSRELKLKLDSHKDESMFDIMDLFRLEGPAAETPGANQLQPSPEQLMLPIHRPEDQVVIEKTSLLFYLDVIHARVQRI